MSQLIRNIDNNNINSDGNYQLNWGILGCARIAKKNIRAIKLSKNNKLLAISSRSLDKINKFVNECDLSLDQITLYTNYDDLLSDNRINAVYIPIPSSDHLNWVIKAANRKIHILLEKPAAVHCDILKQIIKVCDDNNVLYMDGVMFMHHERLNLLRGYLSDPFTGVIARINSSFSFNGSSDFIDNDIRTSSNGDPLGAIGDLGWYSIRLALIAFCHGRDISYFSNSAVDFNHIYVPSQCTVRCNQWTVERVPIDCEGIIWFTSLTSENKKKYLRFDCSFLLPFRQSYEISLSSDNPANGLCDKIVRCFDFVISTSDVNASFEVEQHPNRVIADNDTRIVVARDVYSSSGCQEANMFTRFASYINTNNEVKVDESVDIPVIYWRNISLWNQTVVDACYQSMLNDGKTVDIKPPY